MEAPKKSRDTLGVERLFFLALFLTTPMMAQAGILLDLSGSYLSDDLTSSTTRTSEKMYYGLGVLFNFNKKIWGGWSYSGITTNDKATTTADYSSMNTGPSLKWQFGKNEMFSLTGTFNILSRGTFSNGTTAENWDGMSYLVSFALTPEYKEGLHIGASLNYFAASYNKKTVNNVESSASNSKNWIFPALTLTKQW